MPKSWKLWAGAGAAVLLIAAGGLALVTLAKGHGEPEPEGRLPADFEPAGTVVLACHDLVEKPQARLLVDLVQATNGRATPLVLTGRPGEELAIRTVLAQAEIDDAPLRFLESPHESSRVGQYGPFWIERPDKGPALIDAPRHPLEPRRSPQTAYDLAEGLDLPVVRLALYLSRGNLISNGQGLAIATTSILDQNADLGWDEDTIRRTLREALGIQELAILETLEEEPTGHVELFATFTSNDTVVVGQYQGRDGGENETNAAILDRNARLLEQVNVEPGKKLKVERIPMPPALPGVLRSYTPVVFLEGALLVPTYAGLDAMGQRKALATYERLLPDCTLVPIDVRTLEAAGVTLRSLVLPLGGRQGSH